MKPLPATDAETVEARRLHAVWRTASDRLEQDEIALKNAQDFAEQSRDDEAKASEAYLDFHTAYWAKRGGSS